MNYTGQHLYAFDQPYHMQTIGSGEYQQEGKEDSSRAISSQMLPNNFIPIHQNSEPHYLPVFDPYLAQMPQTINAPLYPIHGMNVLPNGNTALTFPYAYPNTDGNVNRCYLDMQNAPYLKESDYYNSLMAFNQARPQFLPQINYQSNQITVVPNIQINSSDSVTYSPNNYIEITQNMKDQSSAIQEPMISRVVSFRGQENHRRSCRSQRGRIKYAHGKPLNSDSFEFMNKCKSSMIRHSSNSPVLDEVSDPNSGSNDSFMEVLVTNLDYNIGAKEWKKLLYNQFQSALKRVHSVYIQTQTDGTNCALVRVNSIEDARLAISQFHRKKIGYKRIQVNLVNSSISLASGNMKQEVASLLKSVAGYSLSVFKFMELYEKRYHRNISISDFYKMKDFVEIKDVGGNQNGKIISLTNTAINYIDQSTELSESRETFESSVCTLHCKEGTEEYLAAIESSILPNVEVKLNVLSEHVHKILQSHNGDVPLISFLSCYRAEFIDIKIIKIANPPLLSEHFEPEQLTQNCDTNDQGGGAATKFNEVGFRYEGVPLEHLLSCIPGIKIVSTASEIKRIQWDDKKGIVSMTNSGLGGILVDRLHQFSREVVDLIKHQQGCKILLSKFIPTYHHHFGKQCRVADYGFSKLHELIDALPQVVHVIGFGYMRMLFLSHKVQIRRFTNELMKVLKSQSTKTCTLSEYPILYKSLFHKDFNVTDYGVCYLDDLLDEIPESTLEVVKEELETFVSMPKRIQTSEEKERTMQFATEVVDLLKETPRCKLPFNKFIPSYHHHFSRQCKVAEYGFTKLMELLEAIPFVVQIVEEHGEKYVLLTQFEILRVFGDQVLNILEKSVNKRVQLSEFSNFYLKTHGYPLNTDDFSVKSIPQLINKIPKIANIQRIKINSPSIFDEDQQEGLTIQESSGREQSPIEQGELFICLADRNHVKYLAHKVLLVLLEVPNGSLPDYKFVEKYHYKYREEPVINVIEEELYEIVQVESDSSGSGSGGQTVRLKPLILFSRDLKDLLKFNQGKMSIMQLEPIYEQQYGISLKPQNYGYPSIFSLIQACDFVVSIKGRGIRATMVLNQDFVGTLSYRVAYSTKPFLNVSNDGEENYYRGPAYRDAPPASSMDAFESSLLGASVGGGEVATSSPSAPGCMPPMLYSHYLHPRHPFLPSVSSYPYYTSPPLYDPWFRHWYPPQTPPYGYPTSMFPSPMPPATALPPQTAPGNKSAPYSPAASQDQKQIDELVETLAYDSSCSSRMTPPPPSSMHAPWMPYPVQQMGPPVPGYVVRSVVSGDECAPPLPTSTNNNCAPFLTRSLPKSPRNGARTIL